MRSAAGMVVLGWMVLSPTWGQAARPPRPDRGAAAIQKAASDLRQAASDLRRATPPPAAAADLARAAADLQRAAADLRAAKADQVPEPTTWGEQFLWTYGPAIAQVFLVSLVAWWAYGQNTWWYHDTKRAEDQARQRITDLLRAAFRWQPGDAVQAVRPEQPERISEALKVGRLRRAVCPRTWPLRRPLPVCGTEVLRASTQAALLVMVRYSGELEGERGVDWEDGVCEALRGRVFGGDCACPDGARCELLGKPDAEARLQRGGLLMQALQAGLGSANARGLYPVTCADLYQLSSPDPPGWLDEFVNRLHEPPSNGSAQDC